MHVLLTGASSGIGESLARELARRNHRVTLVARRQAELERVAASCAAGDRVRALAGDVGDLEGLAGLVQRAEAGLGPIEALVNNAGIERVARFADVTSEDGEQLMRVNLHAPLRLIRLVLPGMTARGAGTIVNVTSVAGLVPLPYATYYSASKAALSSASEHLRLELAAQKVRVLTVYPGPIQTAMGERAAAAYERDALPRMFWGSSEGLAKAVADRMDSGCARLVYPRAYGVLGWAPSFFRWAQFQLAPAPGKST